ncbi:aspartyl-phosphate phosphatase Spo0E family protein [Paenibacillus sp. MMS20-IR301]|uniref:aspartyl-phosphate phosphatase Spo0E family protein n=1 Tax=Paenibacillus sp. MMS20-IR301 TaxID=2895946 RepID=UPI0028E6C470|nr:aspartyl-phosphate phosphatase Spo0E family protein [Paenibacillus sp. MMS20-IR301]WNS43389.1 aspartyl-phosphate phosphatase Spo0E family protein [Paenibacillus sp. MMS20-IR301]
MGSEEYKDRIEQARQELNKLALEYGMQDVRVLRQSVKLDALLNGYSECHPEKDD